LSPFAKVAGATKENVSSCMGNFKSGHLWSTEHLRCMALYLDVTSQVSKEHTEVFGALLKMADDLAKSRSLAGDWLGTQLRLQGDKSGYSGYSGYSGCAGETVPHRRTLSSPTRFTP
jgi:hypothetical protein